MSGSTYMIRGGEAGAERLRVLSAAMRPATLALLSRAGVGPGMQALDLGCGSGEVTMELARAVGRRGRVVGVELDADVLAHARRRAEAAGHIIEWRHDDAGTLEDEEAYDFVYARFLLSHLPDPAATLARMARALRPGGRLVVEDIDIAAHVHWPPSAAFRRYVELYAATARARGVDPAIGPRLPGLLLDAGLEDIEVAIAMPTFLHGEGKTVARRTLANIADAAVAAGLTTHAEVDALLQELEAHEAHARSIQSTAQVFQVFGRRLL
jgi:SAM-dependent methyltransferase